MSQPYPLLDKCLIALANYAQEAQKTCGLLGDLEDSSDPLDRLLAILAQTQVEDQAQQAYLLSRQQLFDVLANLKSLDHDQIEPLRQLTTEVISRQS